MKTQIEHKIREIADVLFRDMEAGRLDAESVGVLAGKTGVIVFCEHFLRAFPDPAKEAVLERFLENYFEQLTSEVGMLTYCGGLTGALEGLRYLGCRRLLEVDCSDVENHYREVLQNFAMQGILSENYDYLHGGLGVVAYYLDDTPFVNRALEALERTAEKTGTAWKWVSSLGTDRGTGYNICLSHGMSSIVSVLSRADGAGIDRARRDRIVTGACEYIL
nr:lanthionine synthetase LanC family protein [uncultured Alistipes sp.]